MIQFIINFILKFRITLRTSLIVVFFYATILVKLDIVDLLLILYYCCFYNIFTFFLIQLAIKDLLDLTLCNL